MQEPGVNGNVLCQISLPEGLQELMSDISREVLRAQPENVYSFIAKYLSVLLEVRNNIFIAGHICDIGNCSYQSILMDELRNIGLIEEEVVKAANVIENFLDSGNDKETNLFLQILKKTSIEDSQLEAVQRSVQNAFRRHRWKQNLTRMAPNARDNLSSASLAGSYIMLPKYIPYSAHHDTISNVTKMAYDNKLNYCEKHESPDVYLAIKREITFRTDIKYIINDLNDNLIDTESLETESNTSENVSAVNEI